MNTRLLRLAFLLLSVFLFPGLGSSPALAAASGAGQQVDLMEDDPFAEEDFGGSEKQVYDPLEPVNRVFFAFNDKLYFYLLKPVATVYDGVVPYDFRKCVANAFDNLLAPVRAVNNLLQGKGRSCAVELGRFAINSTVGLAGLADPAGREFGLERQPEDLGQTFGVYGLGGGPYICWPVLGPSNARDTVGLVGDSFLEPLPYLGVDEMGTRLALKGGERVNKISLDIGAYERFKDLSFDPYVALRNAYSQHRNSLILDEEDGSADQEWE